MSDTRNSRRAFLQRSAMTAAALPLVLAGVEAAQEKPGEEAVSRAGKPLRILILGGTGFIGPNQVRYALARGHKLTLFNRGRTAPGLFPEVEQLRGDRNNDLNALKGREWDVVIDNPATLPRWVRDSAGLLKNAAKQYIFISTVSVYESNDKPGADEMAALATGADPEATRITPQTYGSLKALAEKEAQKAFGDRATIIRPGLIVGPGDDTGRFTYWPVRIDRGGEVLAPGDGKDPVQFIDARDLGEWCIRMAEQGAGGIYNALGPKSPLSTAELLYGIRAATTADVRFTWVPVDFLMAQNVRPFTDMPLWLPGDGPTAGFHRRSNSRAIAKGLTFRPLADTARATLEDYRALPAEGKAKMRAGMTPEREAAVLTAWKAAQKK